LSGLAEESLLRAVLCMSELSAQGEGKGGL